MAASDSDSAHRLLSFHEKLVSRDLNWQTLREDLAELFLPNRQGFLGDEVPGDERMDRILSSAPLLSRRGLASAVSMMLRPPGRMWFQIQAMDDRLNRMPEVRMWCEAVTRILYDMIYDPRANMEANLAQADDDLVTFGDAIVRIGWNAANKHLVYRTHSLHGAYLLRDSTGDVNGCLIEYPHETLAQVVERFGEDKLTEQLKSKLDSDQPDMEQHVPLLHSVLPKQHAARLGIKLPYDNMEYCSVWTSINCREHLDVGGYYDFPYLVPGWDRSAGEVYSRSPAMVALNDARLLQAVTEDFIEAGHLALRPPTYSAMDMINGPLELFAGGHTHVNPMGAAGNQPPIGVIQLGALPQGIAEYMQQLSDSIGAAFYRDILQLPSARDADLTATEINARLDEYMRQAAPVFSRIEHSYNSPHITRVYGIALRQKLLPDPPPAMQGQPIQFNYESPIKTARDKTEALKIIESINYILPAAQAFPEILDNFNPDALARLTGSKFDLPEELFTPVQDMMAMREQRAKKMKMAEMAELANKAGPALAQIGGLVPKSAQAGLIPATDPNGLPLPAPEMDYEGAILEASALVEQTVGEML